MGWDGKGHVETATSTCSQISRKAQMGDADLKATMAFSKKGRQKGQVAGSQYSSTFVVLDDFAKSHTRSN